CEGYPDGIVGRHIRKPLRTATTHSACRIAEHQLDEFRSCQEFVDAGDASGRGPVQEYGGVLCECISRARLGEESHDHERVAQCSDSARCCIALRAQSVSIQDTVADGGEDVEFQCGLERCCVLETEEHAIDEITW